MTSPFLPNYRDFPTDDEHNLQKQLVNFHNETNTAVNNRTISTFQTNSIPNGERWYPNPNQQRLRDGNRVTLRFSSILNGVHNSPWSYMGSKYAIIRQCDERDVRHTSGAFYCYRSHKPQRRPDERLHHYDDSELGGVLWDDCF